MGRAHIVWLLAGCIALAGCGGSAGSAPSGGSASQGASKPAASTPAASGATRISIGYENTAGTYAPLFVAKEEGLFSKHGLDVTLVNSKGGPTGISYLLGGSAQVATIDGNAAVTAIGKGAQIVIFGSILNDYGFQCWAKPSIKGVADLKGKKVGVSEPGSAVTSAALDMLQRFGLKGSDVELDYLSNVPERVAALIAGKVDAIVLSVPQALRAGDAGMKLLFDLGKLPYLDNGLAATRSYLSAHQDVARSVLEALVDATAFTQNEANKAKVEADIGKYTQISDPKLLEATYAYYRDQFNLDPTIPADVLNVSLKWEQENQHTTLKPEQVVDLSLVRQLEQQGYGGLKAGS